MSLPGPAELRNLKYSSKVPDSQRSRVARSLQEAGRASDALDLFLIAGDADGIREMEALARKQGRVHLLLAIRRAGHEVTTEAWSETGKAAHREERYYEAHRAFTEAGDQAGLAALREKIPDYALWDD